MSDCATFLSYMSAEERMLAQKMADKRLRATGYGTPREKTQVFPKVCIVTKMQ